VFELIQLTPDLLTTIAYAGEKRCLEGRWRADPDAWTEQLRFTQWSVLLEAAGYGGWVPVADGLSCFPWRTDAAGRQLCVTALRQLRRAGALRLRRRERGVCLRVLGRSEAWDRWVLRLTDFLARAWGLIPHP
jgi:hypothetical protein